MAKDKIQPPKQTRAELMTQVQQLLLPMKRGEAESELLSYFTNADLLGIVDNLKKGIRNDIAV